MSVPGLAGLLLLLSCVSIPLPFQGPGQGPGDSGEELSRKEVMEKQDPSVLIAVDRSSCVVSKARFEKAERGDRVFCHWR